MAKPIERGVARAMRAEHGTPVKQLARELEVSVASISLWVRDIELTAEQRLRNHSLAQTRRNKAWSNHNRDKRREAQIEGQARARDGDPVHHAGCMLYWAEGAKSRNSLVFSNSDPHVIGFFGRFLRESLGVEEARVTIRLNVYLGNGVPLADIERHWLALLGLPRSSLRKHAIDSPPTSSSGSKTEVLPFGVCTLRVARSTSLVQHIYGAIQEYAGFDEPRWLDGLY